MKVRDLMTWSLVTALPETTLEEIATMMKTGDTGAIPVVEEKELLGIVTDRDIVLRCVAEGRDPSEMSADDILTEDLEVVDPDADVAEALAIMGRRQIRRLPVVDKGELVGMISLGDLAVKQGDEEETGEALKDVSQGVKTSRPSPKAAAQRRMEQASKHERRDRPEHATQGIANHDLQEEQRRQERVVSIRPEANALPRGQKKTTKRRAS